jgi:hypothetical protein
MRVCPSRRDSRRLLNPEKHGQIEMYARDSLGYDRALSPLRHLSQTQPPSAYLPRFDAADEEVGYEGEHVATEPYGRTLSRKLLRFTCILASVDVLGVVSALIWRNPDLHLWLSTTQLLRTFATQLTPSQSNTGTSSEQVLKIEALKTEISELRTTHEQLVASVVSLRVRQQELQRLSSNKATYWYSEPTALLYRIADARP